MCRALNTADTLSMHQPSRAWLCMLQGLKTERHLLAQIQTKPSEGPAGSKSVPRRPVKSCGAMWRMSEHSILHLQIQELT